MTHPAVFKQQPAGAVHLRQARHEDFAALNGVIERAVMTWQLAERVKRLSLPSYRYHPHDLGHLHILVAEDAEHTIIGVAAWEPASPRDLPVGQRGLLLHGLYVDPMHLRRGVGTHLLGAALAAAQAQAQGFDGLLVKAQADANGFFEKQGMQRLPVEDPARDYPHRFWQAVRPAKTAH
jgi:GNAT superfamily N-acetyltransferase